MTRPIVLLLFIVTTTLSLVNAQSNVETLLRGHVFYLADDSREGRGIGTKGLDDAAQYIAGQFQSIGLQPAFEGNFFDPFEMGWGVTLGKENYLTVGNVRLDTASGIMPYGFSAGGKVEGSMVFAGYGIIAPEYEYDDFAAIDATGKIVLCMTGEPGEFDSTSRFEGLNYTTHSGLRAKAGNAKLKGALAIILVEGPIYASREKEVLRAPRDDEPYVDCGIPALRITREALASLFPAFDLDALQRLIDSHTAPRSLDVDTAHVVISVDLSRKTVGVKNVGGIIPGDSSIIIVGAHYDHLGFGQSGSLEPTPGLIHNGADDNASGVSAILETARLLKTNPVRATVLVVAFTAEEVGLGGSGHLIRHFPLDFSRVRTMINLDMVGRVRENKLIVVGCKTAAEYDSLVKLANTGPGFDLNCKGDGYGPSDNMSFYMADKPVLYLFSGTHEDYHKSTDDADRINFSDLARVVSFTESLVRTIDSYSPALTFVKTAEPPQQGSGRLRSSLGTVPDFSQPDSVKGYLIGDAKPGMAAEKAGLTKGDLVTRIGKVQISNIYDLMNALRIYAPGDTVAITYLREGTELQARAVLQASSR